MWSLFFDIIIIILIDFCKFPLQFNLHWWVEQVRQFSEIYKHAATTQLI